MKPLFLILLLAVFFTSCCVSKHKTETVETKQVNEHTGVTLGRVSHQYRATGCATVVIINWEKPDEQITLIPLDTLSKEFDVDGEEIYFNYHPLKRMNPPGCTAGFPAELSAISKK